jgi:hypothetical protein
MAAGYGNHTEIIDTDANNAVTVTPPASLAAGEMWVILFAVDIDNGSSQNLSTPSGFTLVGSTWTGATSDFPLCAIFYKIAGSSESNVTISYTGNDFDAVAYSIRVTKGAGETLAIDAVGTVNRPTGSGTSVAAPAITVGANGSLAILYAAIGGNGGSVPTLTAPSGSTKRDDRTGWPGVAFATAARNAGAYTPGNWTWTGSRSNRTAQTFSIKATSGGQSITVGQAIAADTAFGVTHARSVTLPLATESDTALRATAAKRRETGLAAETDAAQTLSASRSATIGFALEGDITLDAARCKSLAIAFASEGGSAFPVVRLKQRHIDIIVELDAAFDFLSARGAAIGLAAEFDNALQFARNKAATLGLAGEFGLAFAMARLKQRAVAIAAEADAALSAAARKSRTLNLASEFDDALALSGRKAVGLGRVDEGDFASAVARLKQLGLGIATESDSAFLLAADKNIPIARADEFATAFLFAWTKQRGIVLATEIDTAFDVLASLAGEAIAAWPFDVPLHALIDGYAEEAEDNVLEFTPEVGPPILRRRYSRAGIVIGFSTSMTGAQYAALLNFYRSTLKDGTAPFNRPHPRTGIVRTFRFLGPPRARAVRAHDRYIVDFRIR